jgi:hypothetical protein
MKFNFYNPLHVAPIGLGLLALAVADLLLKSPDLGGDPADLWAAMSPGGKAATALFVIALAWLLIIAIIKPRNL